MLLELILNQIDKKFAFQLIVTILAYFCIRVAYFYWQRHKRYQLLKYYGIKSPETSLLDGNLSEFIKGNPIFLKHEQYLKKYGKVFGYYAGDTPVVVTTNLNQLKRIFLDETGVFDQRTKDMFGGPVATSILYASHSRWKIMRKAMAPSFNSFTMRGSKSTQFVEDSVRLMTEYIEKKLRDNRNADIDIHDLMKATALNLISDLAMNLPGVQVKEKDENVKSLDEFLSNFEGSVLFYAVMFPFLKPILQMLFKHIEYNKLMGLINRKVSKTIDEGLDRLNNSKELDTHRSERQLVDTLIKLHHERVLTREEVTGNIEAILMASYDTTSTTLTYIFWVLAKNPDLQEKLRSDLLINGCESKFLEMVIKETMRLYPTVMTFVQRVSNATVKIDDELTIPAGTKVTYSAWLMHRDPELWPEPEKFEPERFRDGVKIEPLAYAPFGLGERRCIGYQLAMLEMKMIICDMLARFRMKLISPQVLELKSFVVSLSKPKEKVVLKIERI